MSARLTIDATEFSRTVDTLKAVAKKNSNKVLHDEVKLLVKAMHRMTPPFTGKPMVGSLATHRKAGENAIRGDLFGRGSAAARGHRSAGIFVAKSKDELAQDFRTTGGWATGAVFRSKTGSLYGIEKHLIKPNATTSQMAAHHKRYRTKNGRVTTAGSMTRDIGRWKFVDKMHVSEQAADRYVKHLKKKVGAAKSGWSASIRRYKVKGIPKWARQSVGPRGFARVKFNKAAATMVYEWANTVPYVQKSGARLKIMQRAMKFRLAGMKKKFDRALKALERKARQKA